jgi:pimeloyl-ACP methyl ester carboxylesterase
VPRIQHLPIVGLLASGALWSLPAASQAPRPGDRSLVVYASTTDSAHLRDGRVIHMVCMGKGSPTVILTAGAGGWGVAWNKVQPAVARKTRVCAWDRAGSGMSDLSPQPQTIDHTTTDLEAALKAGPVDGPYVAVGHSLGALESLLLADRQPRNVVGMVLVDPAVLIEAKGPGPGPNAGPVPSFVPTPGAGPAPSFGPAPNAGPLRGLPALPDPPIVALFHRCAAALRAGTVRAGGPDPDGCFRGQTFPPEYPPELRAALDKHPADQPPEALARAFDLLAALQSPNLGFESFKLADKPDRDYGSMPLVVLTSSMLSSAPGQPQPSAEQARSFLDAAGEVHQRMATLSKRGVHRVVEGSGHNIQQDKPQAVIDAIYEVVDEARADMARAGRRRETDH